MVLYVTGMLVDFSVAIKQVTVSVTNVGNNFCCNCSGGVFCGALCT